MSDMRRLRAYLDGVPVGTVEQTPQGALSFAYDEDYRRDPESTPLSLSMPLARDRHGNKAVRAYLDGLLPDSQPARQRWAREFNVSANNPFALLRHVGMDAAGAVQMLPVEVPATDAAARDGDVEWLAAGGIDRLAEEQLRGGVRFAPTGEVPSSFGADPAVRHLPNLRRQYPRFVPQKSTAARSRMRVSSRSVAR